MLSNQKTASETLTKSIIHLQKFYKASHGHIVFFCVSEYNALGGWEIAYGFWGKQDTWK